jgi:hypothetical protein
MTSLQGIQTRSMKAKQTQLPVQKNNKVTDENMLVGKSQATKKSVVMPKRTALGELTNSIQLPKDKVGPNAVKRVPLQLVNSSSFANVGKLQKLPDAETEPSDINELPIDDMEVDIEEIDSEFMEDNLETTKESTDDIVEDIDEYDHDDPLFCTEYVEPIFQLLRDKEVTTLTCL